MRLFFDANVLFTAAHNPNGKAALTDELGKRGHWILATSTYAVEEARRNLERKLPASLEGLKPLLEDVRLVEHRPELWFPPGLAEKDRPIFQAAVALGRDASADGRYSGLWPLYGRPRSNFGHRCSNRLRVPRFRHVALDFEPD